MMLVGMATGRHCGCRVLHEVALGTAVLRIHAGSTPADAGRDEPVQFMLTGPDIDVLVDHLKTIRSQVDESAAQPTIIDKES